MEVLLAVVNNWFELLQSVGIIAGLVFTAGRFHREIKERRVANLLEITKQHREIWAEVYRQPGLARVLDVKADLGERPITQEEELFIRSLILHLNSVHHAVKNGVFTEPEGLRKDVRRFFLRPVAKTMWHQMEPFQDVEFVRFVNDCLEENGEATPLV